MLALWVPFPAPGGPRIRMCGLLMWVRTAVGVK
jgi:hypothetical protein